MQKSQRLAEKQLLPGRPREVGRVGLPDRGQIAHLTPARPSWHTCCGALVAAGLLLGAQEGQPVQAPGQLPLEPPWPAASQKLGASQSLG